MSVFYQQSAALLFSQTCFSMPCFRGCGTLGNPFCRGALLIYTTLQLSIKPWCVRVLVDRWEIDHSSLLFWIQTTKQGSGGLWDLMSMVLESGLFSFLGVCLHPSQARWLGFCLCYAPLETGVFSLLCVWVNGTPVLLHISLREGGPLRVCSYMGWRGQSVSAFMWRMTLGLFSHLAVGPTYQARVSSLMSGKASPSLFSHVKEVTFQGFQWESILFQTLLREYSPSKYLDVEFQPPELCGNTVFKSCCEIFLR